VRKGREFLFYLAGHKSGWVPLLIVGVLLILGYYGYTAWSDNRSKEAWTAYYEATQKEDKDKIAAYEKVYQDWSSTRAGFLAAVSVADKAFSDAKIPAMKSQDGQVNAELAQKASDWYGKALGFGGLVPQEKVLLMINQASSLEMGKKYDDALAMLQKAQGSATEYLPMVLWNQGRLNELKQDPKKAEEIYQKVIKDYPNTEFARFSKLNIKRMKTSGKK